MPMFRPGRREGEDDVAVNNIDELVGKVFPWQASDREVAVDRIFITRRGAEYIVNSIHVKTGSLDKHHTAGNLANALGKTDLSDIDSNTISGIFVKLEISIAEVVEWLHKCFPTVKLSIGEATLYTTKSAQAAVDQFKKDHPHLQKCWQMQTSRATALQRAGALPTGLVRARPVRYQWKVEDGTAWLSTVLSVRELQVIRKYAPRV
jgi:hypothetical protein